MNLQPEAGSPQDVMAYYGANAVVVTTLSETADRYGVGIRCDLAECGLKFDYRSVLWVRPCREASHKKALIAIERDRVDTARRRTQ